MATSEMMLDPLTLGDASKILDVTTPGGRYLVARGLLTPVAITRRGIMLFNRVDVERLRDQRRAQRRRRRRQRTVAVNS